MAVKSSGAFARNEMHEVLSQDELDRALQQAGTVTQAFQPPGRQ